MTGGKKKKLQEDKRAAMARNFSLLLACTGERKRFSTKCIEQCARGGGGAGLEWTALVYLKFTDRGTPDTHHRFMQP
jgi:hypothetical protein